MDSDTEYVARSKTNIRLVNHNCYTGYTSSVAIFIFILFFNLMFWKVFAWINLIINLPIFLLVCFYTLVNITPINFVIDIPILVFNNMFLIGIPLLFAYKIYDVQYLSNLIFLKMILIFTIFYNTSNILKDLSSYNFTSIQGFLLNVLFYMLIILSIVSFVFYIMSKHKISLPRVFLK